jgi:hypothetical protein
MYRYKEIDHFHARAKEFHYAILTKATTLSTVFNGKMTRQAV